jgi:hypothetical protein
VTVERFNSDIADAYYEIFIVAVLACLSPFKVLSYAAPPLLAVWIVIRGKSRQVYRRVRFCVLAVALVLFFYSAIYQDYAVTGGFLALITYASFVFLVVVPGEALAQKRLLSRMIDVTGKVVILESCIGILQAVVSAVNTGNFDSANGDAVQGTIHLSFQPDGSFSNPMFAANLAFMVIALIPGLASKTRSTYGRVFLGVVAFVLASVLHMIAFLVIAVGLSFLIFRPPMPQQLGKLRPLLLTSTVPILVLLFLSGNLANLSVHADLFRSGDSPRAEMIHRVLTDMPHEHRAMPFVGLGPGQFSSRAALIATGLYLGGLTDPKSLPFLREQVPNVMADDMMDLWIEAETWDNFASSSTIKPFFSWLSVYTEFGGFFVLAICVASAVLLRRMKRAAATPQSRWMAVAAGAGLIFLLLLGLQENYWEVPQAIFVGVLLNQVMLANLLHGSPPSDEVGPASRK